MRKSGSVVSRSVLIDGAINLYTRILSLEGRVEFPASGRWFCSLALVTKFPFACTTGSRAGADVFGRVKRSDCAARPQTHDELTVVVDRMGNGGWYVPTVLLYLLLKECTVRKDVLVGRRVHALVVDSGYELNRILANHVVRMYAFNGDLLKAMEAFKKGPEPDTFMWESIISAYGERGQAELAVYLYQQMRLTSVQPNDYIFVSVLKACGSAADLAAGKLVHADVVRCGLESNVFVGNSVLDMFFKCGSVEDALRVFQSMPSKDVVTWNVMIAGYSQRGHVEEAVQLYVHMLGSCLVPDNVTFVCILKACVSAGRIQEGRLIHTQVLQYGLEAHVRVGSMLVDMYVKCSSLEDACKVFLRLPNRNVVTCNAMIAGCAHHGLDSEALQLYISMEEDGMKPDQTTFISMLKVCSGLGALEEGRRIHTHIYQQGLEEGMLVGSALVDMYAKCGSLADAGWVFDRLKSRNVVTWSAMISAYVQQGFGQEALRLYERMQEDNILGNSVTFVSLLTACGATGALQEGKRIHEHILERGLGADVCVGTALVDMYAKCGSLEDACKVFKGLACRNAVTWNALLKAYGQHNNHHMVVRCFEEMQSNGAKPDSATFTCLLTACSHVGSVNEGRHYFSSMEREHGVVPTLEHYNCMVDILCRFGHLDEGRKLLETMPHEENSVGWNAFLAGCKMHGDMKLAEVGYNWLIRNAPQHASGYVLMSSMHAETGGWEHVDCIDKLRVRAGAEKKPANALIELNSKVQAFTVGESMDDAGAKLRSLSTQMKQGMGHVIQQAGDQNDNLPFKDEKEDALCGHAEKLAVASGLLNTQEGTTLRLIKNLRMCNDCHKGTKVLSRIERREIIVRDAHRVHHFKDGLCSCGDYH